MIFIGWWHVLRSNGRVYAPRGRRTKSSGGTVPKDVDTSFG